MLRADQEDIRPIDASTEEHVLAAFAAALPLAGRMTAFARFVPPHGPGARIGA